MINMKIRDFLIAACALLVADTAFAQNDFQLPRECSERNNPNPEKCVIPDGPPRAPWVHRVPAVAKTPLASSQANTLGATITPTQSSSRVVRAQR